MIYTVTLNPALDYVLHSENLTVGEINRSEREEIFFGGKGINVSSMLSRLGEDTTALGFIGGFTGDELLRLIEKENINCDFCKVKNGQTRINVKIRSGEETDINARGPEITAEDIENLMKKLDRTESGDYLVLSGSVPQSISDDIYEKILRKLEDKSIVFCIDASGKLLLKTLRHRPFLIKPNHHELGELFGVKAESEEEIISCAKKLQSLGALNILVSRAEKGAILITEDGKIYRSENAEGTLINSVGCGDSMLAGFIAGYIEKKDYSYALKLGTACGNATAYSEGLATRDEIDEILRLGIDAWNI